MKPHSDAIHTEPRISSKDAIFREPRTRAEDFNFGQRTASVFDDMLDRSVPFYAEVQRMIGELASDYATPGTNLYDLGCSTGTTFLHLDSRVAPDVRFIGIDSSAAMLTKAREKLALAGFARPHDFVCADLQSEMQIHNASVVVLNLTLQFIRPLHRVQVIQRIADGLRPGGCLLLVEKLLSPDSQVNRLFIKNYYAFKERQGYSALEISQKREALENVLIPYQEEENRQLLLGNGFRTCETFFRWYNFAGLLAIR